jgi:hypothetical protein
MNKALIVALALGCCGAAAGCSYSDSTRSAPYTPANQTYPAGPSGPQYSSGTDNSMPGNKGGFNNDDINGKSRNAYSTTPDTGPMNANPVASGNTPR